MNSYSILLLSFWNTPTAFVYLYSCRILNTRYKIGNTFQNVHLFIALFLGWIHSNNAKKYKTKFFYRYLGINDVSKPNWKTE